MTDENQNQTAAVEAQQAPAQAETSEAQSSFQAETGVKQSFDPVANQQSEKSEADVLKERIDAIAEILQSQPECQYSELAAAFSYLDRKINNLAAISETKQQI